MSNRLYKPREIAELGLIKVKLSVNSTENVYQFILSEINAGRIKAKDYGTKSRHFWRVSEEEIKRYLEKVDN